jgi:uncharacterized protein YidB (DUF937 family)
MGLLDDIGQVIGGELGNAVGEHGLLGGGILQAALTAAGGLPGLLSRLQSSGLAGALTSWIGTGANQAISGEQVQAALPDIVSQVAGKLGIDASQAANGLAQSLPGLVDKLSPAGVLPEGGGLTSALSGLFGK